MKVLIFHRDSSCLKKKHAMQPRDETCRKKERERNTHTHTHTHTHRQAMWFCSRLRNGLRKHALFQRCVCAAKIVQVFHYMILMQDQLLAGLCGKPRLEYSHDIWITANKSNTYSTVIGRVYAPFFCSVTQPRMLSLMSRAQSAHRLGVSLIKTFSRPCETTESLRPTTCTDHWSYQK